MHNSNDGAFGENYYASFSCICCCLLVLAVVRDHGAGGVGVVGEGVVLVRSKGDGHTEQQKDEFGSRARDQHHVRDGFQSWNSVTRFGLS